jgi:hypothetical protein
MLLVGAGAMECHFQGLADSRDDWDLWLSDAEWRELVGEQAVSEADASSGPGMARRIGQRTYRLHHVPEGSARARFMTANEGARLLPDTLPWRIDRKSVV